MECDAQLAATRLFMSSFKWAILMCKVGHTDLVFGARSGFFSRSAHARLQVSVCCG